MDGSFITPKNTTTLRTLRARYKAAIKKVPQLISTSESSPASGAKRSAPDETYTPSKKVCYGRGKTFTSEGSNDPTLVASQTSQAPKALALTQEQNSILLMVKAGNNVFFSGARGTGKFVLLNECIKVLRVKHPHGTVAVTASTGIGRLDIGGITLHAWAGVGYGDLSVNDLVARIRNDSKALGRWESTKALVIDGVDRIEGDLIDKLALIASEIRHNERPFGGIQLVATGDFLFLKPYNSRLKEGAQYAFKAPEWFYCFPRGWALTKVFKQNNFVDALNQIRVGTVTPTVHARLSTLSRHPKATKPTFLYPTEREAELQNEIYLSLLEGPEYLYEADDEGDERLLAGVTAPVHLRLRLGARVIFLNNKRPELANGSMGKVVGFTNSGGNRHLPIVKFHNASAGGEALEITVHEQDFNCCLPNGNKAACRTQLPLSLGWALSIQKASQKIQNTVVVDLANIWLPGQAYSALSRATSFEGLQIDGYGYRSPKWTFRADPDALQFMQSLSVIDKGECR